MNTAQYFKTLCLFFIVFNINAQEGTFKKNYGALIFEDNFERSESQELKDEVGNGWTTSSDKTAKGNKQVDLRDGTMHIYTHKEANHAVSVRHKMYFKDGAIELQFKLDHPDDALVLNIADMECETVYAGHLINVKITPKAVQIFDLKNGLFDLEMLKARKSKSLTNEQKKLLKSKSKRIPNTLALGVWHHIVAQIKDNQLTVLINGEKIGYFTSEGIAHDAKKLLRILVPRKATVDNLKIWKKDN